MTLAEINLLDRATNEHWARVERLTKNPGSGITDRLIEAARMAPDHA